jgi:hypothetical protein
LEIEPQIELVEEDVRTAKMEMQVRIAKLEVGTKPLVVVHVEIIETIIEDTNV